MSVNLLFKLQYSNPNETLSYLGCLPIKDHISLHCLLLNVKGCCTPNNVSALN